MGDLLITNTDHLGYLLFTFHLPPYYNFKMPPRGGRNSSDNIFNKRNSARLYGFINIQRTDKPFLVGIIISFIYQAEGYVWALCVPCPTTLHDSFLGYPQDYRPFETSLSLFFQSLQSLSSSNFLRFPVSKRIIRLEKFKVAKKLLVTAKTLFLNFKSAPKTTNIWKRYFGKYQN